MSKQHATLGAALVFGGSALVGAEAATVQATAFSDLVGVQRTETPFNLVGPNIAQGRGAQADRSLFPGGQPSPAFSSVRGFGAAAEFTDGSVGVDAASDIFHTCGEAGCDGEGLQFVPFATITTSGTYTETFTNDGPASLFTLDYTLNAGSAVLTDIRSFDASGTLPIDEPGERYEQSSLVEWFVNGQRVYAYGFGITSMGINTLMPFEEEFGRGLFPDATCDKLDETSTSCMVPEFDGQVELGTFGVNEQFTLSLVVTSFSYTAAGWGDCDDSRVDCFGDVGRAATRFGDPGSPSGVPEIIFDFSSSPAQPVPVPAAWVLFAGAGAFLRKRRK
ncbi:MAG: hypothetical protein AAF830_05325 [Pseudomonadota bacterium]